MTISRERTFDEWLADIDTTAGLGYRPILTVLHNEDGFEIHSPALGPELATTISPARPRSRSWSARGPR